MAVALIPKEKNSSSLISVTLSTFFNVTLIFWRTASSLGGVTGCSGCSGCSGCVVLSDVPESEFEFEFEVDPDPELEFELKLLVLSKFEFELVFVAQTLLLAQHCSNSSTFCCNSWYFPSSASKRSTNAWYSSFVT